MRDFSPLKTRDSLLCMRFSAFNKFPLLICQTLCIIWCGKPSKMMLQPMPRPQSADARHLARPFQRQALPVIRRVTRLMTTADDSTWHWIRFTCDFRTRIRLYRKPIRNCARLCFNLNSNRSFNYERVFVFPLVVEFELISIQLS